ncbi:MAG TPA: hypothetical protein VGJ77_04985 [Gaiellaceae bacterium]|jgi:hypothetical protein
MEQAVSPLTVELLTWISARPRTYAEAIEAWQSNCPRHSVWDDARIDGLVTASRSEVTLTARGRSMLGGETTPQPVSPSESTQT